jgi:hypothetical protein
LFKAASTSVLHARKQKQGEIEQGNACMVFNGSSAISEISTLRQVQKSVMHSSG